MRIAILSMYYSNISHGGLLQAFSLCQTVKDMGSDSVEQITYDYNFRFRPKTLMAKVKRTIKKIPYAIIIFLTNDKTKKCYKEFQEQIPHSRYYGPTTINETGNLYDCYIVGSDQVWNMSYCDQSFYLTFVKNARKVAYAASIGKDSVSEDEIRELTKAIESFSCISVREKSFQKKLSLFSDKDISYVCDPVFLNDRSFWDKLAVSKEIEPGYTLIYILSADKHERNKAFELAKKIGNPIVKVPNINLNMSFRDIIAPGQKAYSVGPLEFLGLIKNSDYILTDSFHCVAFSLIFNKNFYAFTRKNPKFNMDSRIMSLLDDVRLGERFIELDHIEDIEIKEIDFQYPNEQIAMMSNSSKVWLKNALGL